MNNNLLYGVIGGLVVIVAVLGDWFYQDQQKSGIELNVGNGGITIEKK